MIYHAHYVPGSETVTVRDDRGTTTEQFTVSEPVPRHGIDLKERLAEAGWRASAGWTETDQGWHVPVERTQPQA